jgi:RHS repeat-associated protein
MGLMQSMVHVARFGSGFRSRANRWVSAVTALTLVSSLASPTESTAAPAHAGPPPLHHVKPVSVTTLKTRKIQVEDQTKRTFDATPAHWPAASTTTVVLSPPAGNRPGAKASAPGLPVWARAVAPKKGAYEGPRSVEVKVLPHDQATGLGVNGVVFTVGSAIGGGGDLQVGVDSGTFGHAFGGNYASRLHLVRLPACALTRPERAACRVQTPVTTSHDPATQSASAMVTLATQTADPASDASATSSAKLQDVTRTATVLAAVSDTGGGGGGDYSATALKPSGSWSAGGSSGAFTYSYPIALPDSAGGLKPTVGLSYNSGSVDGQTSSTAAQASWAGDGWNTGDSYIEQTYTSCSEKPEGTASPVSTGDRCYDGPILTLSLNGSSTSLVKDAAGNWTPTNDQGEKVTHVTNSHNGSGTYNTDYWTVTSRDGTVYEFGRNQLPGWSSGMARTNSVDTVPVYSAHSGDPCYDSAGFASSLCTMAYRWHLDYVVDVHDDAMAYYYHQDLNHYSEAVGSDNAPYIRSSYLSRIDYGFRDGDAYGTVPNQVVYTTSGRCTLATCDGLSATTAAVQYPDVPYDLVCADGATCQQQSPSFFSTVRLTSITTKQYSTATSTYKAVDTYTLHETEPATGDGYSPTLWLSSITHTGNDLSAGGSSAIALPDVKFAGIDLKNRVDTSSFPGLYRYRISAVTNEMGGVTSITYGLPEECTAAYVATAIPSSNTKSCYPVSWMPKDYTAPITDWFEKYAVTQVLESDSTGGSVAKETDYTYSGGAAWHHDDNEVVKAKDRTWGQFRGYGTVTTVTGDGANDPQTKAVTAYYRGMDDDWLTSSSTRSVTLTDSQGGQHPDTAELAGAVLESTVYKGAGGAVDHSSVTSYWISPATATRTRPGLPDLTARTVHTAEVWNRQAITGSGSTSWRYTEEDTTYDNAVDSATFGLPTHVYRHTVPANSAYDQCTSTTYAPANTAKNLVGLTSTEETDSVACAGFSENSTTSVPKSFNSLGAPTSVNRPAQVVSATRTFYDDPTFAIAFPQTAAPTAGDVTMVRKASGYSSGAFTWQTVARSVYDQYGRVVAAYDGNGNETSSTYTTNSVGLTTTTDVTNPKHQTASTTVDPARGVALTTTDANGLTTTAKYDALGRTTAIWAHDRPTSAPADVLFTYVVSQTGVSGVTTKALNDSLGYVTSTALYDSLGRSRQTQTPTPQGGRLVTESIYDSHGWVRKKNNGYWDADHLPAMEITSAQDSVISNQDVYTFDGLGRIVIDESEQYAVTKETTTTVYNGDTTTVFPPQGGTVKSTTTDPAGRTVSVASYSTPPTLSQPANTFTGNWSVSGGTSNEITYGYDGHGNQNTVNSGGSNWINTFDLLGRVTSKDDPDAGTATIEYDADSNVTQTTDARGKTVSFVYDALNRKTAEYAAATGAQASANQIAAWVYDNDNSVANVTNPIGQLTTETSYNGGSAYVTQQRGFNAFGQSLGVSVTLPSTEGALGRTWAFKHTYTSTGLLYTDSYPLGGGLPAQTVLHGYSTALDLPNAVGDTSYGYAQNTTYSAYGQILQETIGSASSPAYLTNTYDPHRGLLTDQLLTRSTAPATIDDESYDYDPAGNITRQVSTRLGVQAAPETQCYSYDPLDRLTAAWTALDGCAAAPTATTHAQVGDLLSGGTGYWTSWTFDILGQRTSQTDHATVSEGTDTTTSYIYKGTGNGNTADQPHTLTSTQSTGGTTASTSYTYDASGNTVTRTTPAAGTQNLAWDNANRLTQIAGTTAGTTSYVYDADGNVLLQKDPAGTILYLPGQQITLDTATGTTTGVRYITLPGGGTVVRTGSGANYGFEFGDLHGTNGIRLDNTAQTPTWRQFTPYGDTRGAQPTWTDNRGFLNAPTNTTTGLVQLGARQYDPALGRFISLDPLFEATDDQLLNGYTYTRDNPVGQSDPSGLRPDDCAMPGFSCGSANGGFQITDPEGQVVDYATGDIVGYSKPKAKTSPEVKKAQSTLSNLSSDRLDWLRKHLAFYMQDPNWMIPGTGANNGVILSIDRAIHGHYSWKDLFNTFKGPLAGMAVAIIGTVLCPESAGTGCLVAVGAAAGTVSQCVNNCDNANSLALAALAGAVTEYAGIKIGGAGKTSSATGCNSFSPDTEVLLADGKSKAIKDIQKGDVVEAANPLTGRDQGAESVTATIVHHDDNLVDLTIRTPDGHLSVLHTTTEHPFWDATLHAWANAIDLVPGHRLGTLSESAATIAAIKVTPGDADRYNLTVQRLHTYYVLAGNVPVLVHNSSCGTGPDGLIELDLASQSGTAPDRGGYSLAGRALQKHAGRAGTGANWPKPSGRQNADGWNEAGQNMLDDILTNPDSVAELGYGRIQGTWQDTLDIRLPNGMGARFDLNGNFSGFLD